MSTRRFEQSEMVRVWTLLVIRVLALLAMIVVLYWVVRKLRTVLLMLVLSVFFCYLIAPVVRLFEQPVYIANREIRMPRVVAIGAVYILIGLVLFGVLQLILPILWDEITQLASNLPNYISSASTGVSKTFNDANSWMRHVKLPKEWREWVLARTTDTAVSILPWLQKWVVKAFELLTFLPWMILVPITSFFLLKDATKFEQSVVALMPNERLRKRAHWLLLDVSQTLAAYIRAQLTACLIVGAVVTVVFGLIGVPYAVVLGAIAGLLEFVPMVGPLLAALIAVSLTLITSVKLALIVAVFLIVYRILHDYMIYPWLVGHGIKMHPLVVVLAILAGAEIGGLTGIFLAIPFVGLIIVGYNHYLAYKGIHSLDADITGEKIEAQPEPQVAPKGASAPLLEK